MPVYDITGGLRLSADSSTVIEVRHTGSLVKSDAVFLNFSGSAVQSVTTSGDGVNITLFSGSAGVGSSIVQFVEGSPSPRLRTTASFSVSSLSEFAEDRGIDVHFYVSGTITTGSSGDNLAVFGGSVLTSGNLFVKSAVASQSFIGLQATEIPAPPVPGNMRLFATKRAERMFPSFMGPSGLDVLSQPAIFGNAIMFAGPNTTTTLTSWGTNFTTSGTVAHNAPIALAVSGIMGTVKNSRFTPAAAIGNGAGIRTTDTVCWRGSYSGSGGWFVACRFGSSINAPTRFFVGLNSSNAFLGHTTDISASTEFIGIGWDRQDPLTGVWRVMRRDASTYVKDDIPNMSRLATTGSLIDFICFAPPNASFINVQVIEHVSTAVGTVALSRWNSTFTSSLPVATTFLRFGAGTYTQTGSATGNFFLNRFYMETDY